MDLNITEECLRCLNTKNWMKLNELLSNEHNCNELATDRMFSIFETNLISEVKRYEKDVDEDLYTVLAQVFSLYANKKILNLSAGCAYELAEYLFEKNPNELYAKVLTDNPSAQKFLKAKREKEKNEIETTKIAAHLNVKVGVSGRLCLSRSIFKSPQEEELYLAAKNRLKDEIIIPNVALSTIINDKVLELLDKKIGSFFYKSTLDLCIINPTTFKPIFFIELDSSYHDDPKQIVKDKMKDNIFEKAGLKLYRLRKRVNKSMEEEFGLFISNNYLENQ